MVKNIIRKSLLEQGQLLSNDYIIRNDPKIQNTALNKIDIASSTNNLLYFPYKKEININLLANEIKINSNNIYMPRIFSNKKMKFNLLSESSIFKVNKYGIKEIENTEYLEPSSFDTMFIPFVGVDKNGCRLGYGGGYFDRTLEGVDLLDKRPLIVGMGFDYQLVNKEFGMTHDIKYDIVITETRVLSFT
tara:strand:- start:1008 stop:1577 length:570 start_codon:yes stop_codon:yes gene_type:complete